MQRSSMGRCRGIAAGVLVAMVLSGVMLPGSPAWGQAASFPKYDDRPGSERGRRRPPTGSVAPNAVILKADPRQRLDVGALVCRTEAELKQHQAAVAARLDGREVPEPGGCRLIGTMTAVNVIDRHGIAATQVRVPGPPEQVVWTDVAIPQ